MKKMKRYAGQDESMVEGDASVAEQMEKAPAKKQSFSEAFAAARDRGDKDFAWEGKPGMRFSTKMREDKPAPTTESITKTTVKTEAPAPKAEEPAKAEKSKRGIGPYNVFAGPDEPDLAAVQAAKAAGAARRAKQAAEPMVYNPFRGAINALRERGKKSNPEAYAKGGSVSSASKRADGIAQRGKTRGKMC